MPTSITFPDSALIWKWGAVLILIVYAITLGVCFISKPWEGGADEWAWEKMSLSLHKELYATEPKRFAQSSCPVNFVSCRTLFTPSPLVYLYYLFSDIYSWYLTTILKFISLPLPFSQPPNTQKIRKYPNSHKCFPNLSLTVPFCPIHLTHFLISATCGENKYCYLVSPPGNWVFFPQKSLTGGWEIISYQPNFQEGYMIAVFIFGTGGSTYHILVFWRKGIRETRDWPLPRTQDKPHTNRV